ncbi:MAG: WcaI family glycosyltransferase [Thermomicrobiales bacterium]
MGALTVGRIALFGINYWPEQTGIAPYTTGLAEHLAERGWQTTVCAGMPHYPQWHVADGYARRLRQRETINGVEVLRFRHHVPEQPSAVGRALYEATFLAHALSARRMPRPDVVLGIIPSFSGGALAALAAQRYQVPFGIIFQDLMGQAAVQSGIAGGARVAGATRSLEASVARRASLVGVIAEGFRPYLEEIGVEPGRIRRVRNWTHIARPSRSPTDVRARFGLPLDAWICLHAGNMGLKQGLENVIACARLALTSDPGTLFVLMGDGNQRAHLQQMADGLPNVRFLPPQPAEEFPDLLAAADILLVNQRPTVKDMSLPGKLTSYFAAGRPVVAAVAEASETAAELRTAQAGVVVPAGAPDQLLAAIRDLASDQGRANHLGRQGQAYADDQLTAGAILARLEQFVLEVAGPRFAQPPLAWPAAVQEHGPKFARRVG